jgi:sporulation protein YlmC with PRC-barrel domain
MALLRIRDFDPHDARILTHPSLLNYSVKSEVTGESLGTIEDILVDEHSGAFRYFIVNISSWISGKQVLLPLKVATFDHGEKQVYARGLTREQAEQLPEFNESLRIDPDDREQERTQYRPSVTVADPERLERLAAPIPSFDPLALGALSTLPPLDASLPPKNPPDSDVPPVP